MDGVDKLCGARDVAWMRFAYPDICAELFGIIVEEPAFSIEAGCGGVEECESIESARSNEAFISGD